jgi:AmmeMemoRadiSam system protein B
VDAFDALPRLRDDISVSVFTEGDGSRLLLQDPMGIADGPILLHVDMVDILQACDGLTTYAQLALDADVSVDGAEMLRLRSFMGQLSTLGFMDDARFAEMQATQEAEFSRKDVREPVCAGSSYPTDADELAVFLADMLGPAGTAADAPTTARGALVPHLDFRVAPHVYGPAFAPLRGSDADLVVIIGTSHYWWQHPFILTAKHFRTPLGTVVTDHHLVDRLRMAWADIDPSLVAPTDLAHRPEHSLEYHVLGVQHLLGHRPVRILPILVSGSWTGDSDEQGAGLIRRAMDALRALVNEQGRRAFWLVSGDLAHVGRKFGDAADAESMVDDVRSADDVLLEHLQAADPDAWYAAIRAMDDRYRICGQAPVYAALHAFRPNRGRLTAYDVWHEAETASAVTVAGISWE